MSVFACVCLRVCNAHHGQARAETDPCWQLASALQTFHMELSFFCRKASDPCLPFCMPSHPFSLLMSLSLPLSPSLCCYSPTVWNTVHAKRINMPMGAQGSERRGRWESIRAKVRCDRCPREIEFLPAGKVLDSAVCVRVRQPGR